LVPSLAPASFDDHEVGALQHFQVLHHAAAVEFRKQRAELARGHRCVAQVIE
jgi:hypothetical protein